MTAHRRRRSRRAFAFHLSLAVIIGSFFFIVHLAHAADATRAVSQADADHPIPLGGVI